MDAFWGLLGVAIGGGLTILGSWLSARREDRRAALDRASKEKAEVVADVRESSAKALAALFIIKRATLDPRTERWADSGWDLPDEPLIELYELGLLIREPVARAAVVDATNSIDAWRLLLEFSPKTYELTSPATRHQRRVLQHLEAILSATSRGEAPPQDSSGWLRVTGEAVDLAADARYEAEQD